MNKAIFLILLSLCFHTTIFAETEKQLYDNGILFFKQGQYQKAINAFTNLIEIAPYNADAYKNRGVSYMKQEKFDLAIQDFEKAKKLFPELKGLYSNLGVAWYYKKEYEKAIKNYDIEIEMAPENHVAYFNRALCLAELDRNKEALDDLSTTLKLKPDFYWAICYKADLLALEGENIKAIENYEKAIKQDPKNTYATEKLVQLRQKVKKKEDLVVLKSKYKAKKTSHKIYTLQTGAYLHRVYAKEMEARLINNKLDARILILTDKKKRTWYLVRSGHFENRKQAKEAGSSLRDKLGIDSVIRPAGTW